jgi:hypothetical protein
MGRTYRTLQGKEIDMDKLMTHHELMPAIGNAGVNARGDEIGTGGKILRTKEQVMADYYENNPKARPETRSQPVVQEDKIEMDYNETLPTKRNK